MFIGNPRFGGEFRTADSSVFTFDAIECMAASYATNHNAPSARITDVHFADYNSSGKLLDTSRAILIQSHGILSPMGLDIVAVSTPSEAKELKKSPDDVIMTWKECIAFVKKRWGLPPPKTEGQKK
jgi:hypothetical protein